MTLSAAFFLSDELHRREVALPDGSAHTLHFREAPAAIFRNYWMAMAGKDAERQSDAIARLVVASLANPDGTPGIDFEHARTLRSGAENAIMGAILEINGYAAKEKPAGNA